MTYTRTFTEKELEILLEALENLSELLWDDLRVASEEEKQQGLEYKKQVDELHERLGYGYIKKGEQP